MKGEQIIVESVGPVCFEPYCVCCGSKTRGRYYLDTEEGAAVAVFVPWFLSALLGRVWVPFCLRCRLRIILPGRKAAVHVLFAVVFIAMGFYLFMTEWMISGLLIVLASFVALFVASRQSRRQRAAARPFKAEIERDKVRYIFTAGHFYEEQMQKLDEENDSKIS